MRKLFTSLTAALFLGACGAVAQTYHPSPENIQARKQFQDMKFGIFIHWGIYSMLADGEWVQHSKRIDRNEYSHLAAGFCPSRFNAREWVEAFKDAGAGYVTITSRHHDGFSMFGTDASSYNIVDATPFGRDILKELAGECERQGLKLHIYYSHMDWFRPDYPAGSTSKDLPHREAKPDWNSYFNFMNTQLTEILTGYGKIGAIWFDGMWDHADNFDWQLDEQYALIHRLQPACLIGNNHHSAPHEGEDFQLFEQDLPGENSAGFSGGQKVSDALPLESCQTMNSTWGYSITDKSYKSADELIRRLVKSAGMNSNLLLNIGPRPDGCLPDEAMERLKEIGKWTKRYGETIFGTRGGLIKPCQWGVSTQKGDTLYLHILNLEERTLTIPLDKKEIKSARMYDDGSKLKIRKAGNGSALISLPATPQGVDTIVEIVLRKQKRG